MYICTRWWKSFSIFLRLQYTAILDSDVYILRPCVFIKSLKPGILYPANDANGCSSSPGHAVCTASSRVPKSVYCTAAAASDCPYNGRVCTAAASAEALFPYDGLYILPLSVCLMIGYLLTAFLTEFCIIFFLTETVCPLSVYLCWFSQTAAPMSAPAGYGAPMQAHQQGYVATPQYAVPRAPDYSAYLDAPAGSQLTPEQCAQLGVPPVIVPDLPPLFPHHTHHV